MKDFADDNLKFEENGRKLFKPVENTVGKGEIARYEQFLHFPSWCFQKACFPGESKGVIVWEWVNTVDLNMLYNSLIHPLIANYRIPFIKNKKYQKDELTLSQTSPGFYVSAV